MHQSSFDRMQKFRNQHLQAKLTENLTILDLGSQEVHVNGSYKPIFQDVSNWKYVGIDMVAGNNVNIVLNDPYKWSEVASNSADVLISGQAFEHIEFFWLSMLEVERVLKPGGICCIIAPSGGHEHRYPVDCWRFYADGFSALARYARLIPLEVATQWSDLPEYDEGTNVWHDSVLIAQKPARASFRNAIRRALIQLSRKFE